MILKGSQRSGGKQLAAHLLNERDNEHVHVHDLRGFVADDLHGAFHEAYGISRGTRAKQYLFSLSLNPPPGAKVLTRDFEAAIDTAETALGLTGQPRAVVFHEKDGRRHAHAVWSRIDAAEMKAINLAHTKLKLRAVSKDLYLDHGWQMPRGLVDSKERDPASYSHAEWSQAKRGGHDPKALKAMFQECWSISDGRPAFAQALKARGYTLAKGDRRGIVAVDYRGEVYAVSKFVGLKAKDVCARLGDPDSLPDIAQAKHEIAGRMTGALERHVRDAETKRRTQSAALAFRKAEMIQRQRQERRDLDQRQATRWAIECRMRAQRYADGWRGLWERIAGTRRETTRRNEMEALQCLHRDRAEMDRLIFAHIDERGGLHAVIRANRARQAKEVVALHREIGAYARMRAEPARERPREPTPEATQGPDSTAAPTGPLKRDRTPTSERLPRRSRSEKDLGRDR